VDDHEESSLDSAGKYSFGKRTACIKQPYFWGCNGNFRVVNTNEQEREDQRDYKQTQPPLMTELILLSGDS
jgi:hypothetical protein